MDVKFFCIDWSQVENMVIRLAHRLQGQGVWGVPRGGRIVTSIMAYHGCKCVYNIDNANIIVDDIADSGATLRPYNQPTASLVVRHGCPYLPDYWVTMIATSDYILFPWEETTTVLEQESYKTRES